MITTEETGLKQWMSWCDEKIAKFGDVAPTATTVPESCKEVNKISSLKISAMAKQAESVTSEQSNTGPVKQGSEVVEAATGVENATADIAAQEAIAMPVPKIKVLRNNILNLEG